jgi:hypothetical protein
MFVIPAEIPVTTPDDEPTTATEVAPLSHDPPGVASVRVMVVPAQSELLPLMGAGTGYTVKVVVTNEVPTV